ncbi:sigma-70 family RNA polymerase sigma factor [Streptomyces sp. NPDC002644]
MDTLTIQTVQAAQAKDLDAIGTIVREMEPRIEIIARKAAISNDQREEFMQVGRIAVWRALERFTGDTMDNFYAFMFRTVETTIKDAARTEKNAGAAGADHKALTVFAAMMKLANDDETVAEQLCMTVPAPGKRLSRDRAHAARLAYAGTVSLDAGSAGIGDTDMSLGDTLISDYGVPEDLIAASDLNAEEHDRKRKLVRAIINSMGDKGAHILRSRWGIAPANFLGRGTEADEILAEELNTKPATVRVLRNQAHKSFATRYTRITGITPCMCADCEKIRAAEGISL